MSEAVQKKVLIVEDNKDIANLLEITFNEGGYEAEVRTEGIQALAHARKSKPDLIILDIMLPGLDGVEILKELRQERPRGDLAVIMLTAKGDEIDRVLGLELGADDYVVKPFSPRELLLRAKVILDRPRLNREDEASVLKHGDITVDLDAYRVQKGDEELVFTATEFRLLVELLRHKGKARSREQLLSSVWGYSFDGYARTVDTHMRRLRQKLGALQDCLETVRGVGYRFNPEPALGK